MGVRSFEERYEEPLAVRRGAGAGIATLVGAVVLALLLVNGRPIGAPDPSGLVPLLARPFEAAAGLLAELDETARALVGKLVAATFAALAAAFLFAAVSHRRPTGEAGAAAFLLALGSSLAAAGQSLSAHAPAAAAIALVVLFLVRADDEPEWAERAGLPLSLAVALLPAAAAPAIVIALAVAARGPMRAVRFLLWAIPGLLLLAGQTLTAGGEAPIGLGWLAPPGPDALARLVSPARGALLFSPVALVAAVGLVRALRRERWLAGTLGLAFVSHALVALCLPDNGPSWGTLTLTAAWPLLFAFLPEGLDATRYFGVLLAAGSVAIQALGAFAYDGRWDRLYRDEESRIVAPWDVAQSPIAFQIRERQVHLAVPAVAGRHVILRQHLAVLGAPEGSRIAFAGERPIVTGADPTLGEAAFVAGARVVLDKLELSAAGDGLVLRVLEHAHARRLELRIAGRGRGTLAVAEGGFWNPDPRVTSHPVSGEFRLRQPYYFPESGGGDLSISLRAGNVELRSVSLVPPGEPENVIRLQGTPED